MTSKQRDRGRILTPEALAKLQYAIRDWEVKHEKRCTQERMKELTSEFKEGGLDPGTISKILKGKSGVDPESIRCLFNTFGLMLEEADLLSSTPFVLQVDPNFVGREGAIADLNTLISRGSKVIVIQARGGVGKTTLARKYLQQEFDSVLEFPIAKETKDIASIESLIEEKLRQLDEEPGREFLVSIDRLKRKLQAERIGFLIDNLEPALDAAGKFIEPHRRYVELLRVLADPSVQSITLVTSRERLHEPGVTVQHYPLKSLDTSAWEQFFQLHQLPISTTALAALHHAYGGNAKAMEIISSVIQTDYSGDVETYWQENQNDLLIERDLEDLVTNQFDRLQEVDPDAYKLLCRMGCYRYQDVPTVPTEGVLCLLWDVPESRQKRVIRSLQERSLVEVEDGEHWLHPVIRAEAISQLRASEDWEVTNRRAAEFWSKNIQVVKSVEDALKALEAHYHYLAIRDSSSASYIILEARPTDLRPSTREKYVRRESLGKSFYRLGLFKQLNSAIYGIVNNLRNSLSLSLMYHLLADLQMVIGSIHYAEELYRKSGNIANECLENWGSDPAKEFDLKKRQIESVFNVGLCKIELWELQEAVDHIENALEANSVLEKANLGKETTEQAEFYWLVKICAWSCLSFLYSETSNFERASSFADKTYKALNSKNESLNVGLNLWGEASSLLFLGNAYRNLNKNEQSLKVYKRAISCLENLDYLQIKARILTNIAVNCRKLKNSNMALEHHARAIQILEEIDAKCDLAEARYQLALTHQMMGERESSIANFQRSIQLFTEIKAPKQVERVRRAMEDRN